MNWLVFFVVWTTIVIFTFIKVKKSIFKKKYTDFELTYEKKNSKLLSIEDFDEKLKYNVSKTINRFLLNGGEYKICKSVHNKETNEVFTYQKIYHHNLLYISLWIYQNNKVIFNETFLTN
jgi:hypothetical protein